MVAAWQVWRAACLAQGAPRVDWLETLWATLALVGALLVGAFLIWWVDRWRKRSAESTESPNDQLAHFRALYDQGELSPEEFERIRHLLGKRLRQELDVAQPPPPERPDTGIQPPPGPC
jgi:hypothetical protein